MQQLITTPNKIKCINLDWLSVYCLEPKGVVMNAAYFKALGWTVEEREYGTPQYREKFTLMNGRHPFLEIERNPYSLKQNGGIFEPESCHIRLANRTLYQPQPVQQLTNFIVKYGYEYKGISRVDVCCDLTIFDNAMKPQDLANKYMKDKIWKVHQSKIDAHSSDGDDSWRIPIHLGAHGKETKTGRTWNSLKWGSPKSALSTKLYNKTLELETNTGKFYIKDAWVKCGLCDLQKVRYEYRNPKTKETEIRTKQVCVVPGTAVDQEIPIEGAKKIDVWRVEFSMNSEGRKWIDLGDNHVVDLSLNAFDNLDSLAATFFTCSEWLFCFIYAKWITKGPTRMKERTNRCKKLQLFNTKFLHSHYKPQRQTETEDPSRTEKIMMYRLINKSKDKNLSEEYREACRQVALEISKEHGEWWVPDEMYNGRMVNHSLERKRVKEYKEDHPQTVEQFRKWAEYQSEITAEFSKAKIDKYIDVRRKLNNQIEKRIEQYKDEIRKLYERIKKNEIQTEKDVNELRNIFGDPF